LARVGDVNNSIIIFNPFLAFNTSPVDHIFIPLLENMIDTPKPCIRQISRLELSTEKAGQFGWNLVF